MCQDVETIGGRYHTPIKLLTVGVFVCRAVGNRTYGSLYREQITESLRKAAEHCDCLQSFFVIHSMGGGTEHRTYIRKQKN